MSYHFGNLQWAIAHVASLFGAYFAGVLIYAYSAEKNNTGPSANRSWLVSFPSIPNPSTQTLSVCFVTCFAMIWRLVCQSSNASLLKPF